MNTYLPVKSAIIAAAAVLVLYIFTLAPDLVWQDQGDYQYQSALMNLNRPDDVVRVHPLYIVVSHALGRFTPLSWAYAANLTSAICASIAVFSIFLIIAMLTGRRLAAGIGSGVYAFAHTPWFTGVQAQTYSMAMALFTAGLLAALIYNRTPKLRYLLAIGLLFGLGISTHLMTQLGFAVIAVRLFYKMCRGELKILHFAAFCLCWAAGACLLWFVMAVEYKRTGDFQATLYSAIWGLWGRQVFNIGRIPVLFKNSVMFFILNFPTPLVLFCIPGFILSFKRCGKAEARLLAAAAIIYALFAMRYDVRNQNHFFLPMYALVCVYIALGYAFLIDKANRRIALLVCAVLFLMPAMYPMMANIAKQRAVNLGTNRHIPYRDVYRYYLIPWQQNQTGPRRMADELMLRLPQNAVLYADTTVLPPLQYVMYIEGKRPDITLMDSIHSKPPMPLKGRVFTVCDAPRYRPPWAEPRQLVPFAISESEYIYEITALSAKQPAAGGL